MAKATETKSETPPNIDHIRVGPPFALKRKGRCVAGKEEIPVGETAHVLENTRAETKKLICPKCLDGNPVLKARLSSDDLGSFLEE